MQGLGLKFDPSSITKLKQDYERIIRDLENRKIVLNFSEINNEINKLTSKIKEVQNINLGKNILPVTLKEQVKTIQDAVNAYTQLGKVNVTNKVFDNKELSSFIVNLERAEGIIDKIQYVAQKDDEGKFTGLFNVSPIIKEIDNTAKIADQLVKDEQRLAEAMSKGREQAELKNKAEQKNLELKQAQAANKALDEEFNDRQKIVEAIEKTIQKRNEENRKMEESQAKASNKALDEMYKAEQNRLQWLETLGKDITPKGFGLDVTKSTYEDMEKLAKTIGGVNAEIKRIDVQPLKKHGDSVREVTYRVKEGTDKWHEYKVSVVQSGKDGAASLRKLDLGAKDVINRQVGMLSRLKNAWVAVASFASVTTVFYKVIHEIKNGIELLNSLDIAMTNIQMITGRTRAEVLGLSHDFSKLASELHTTQKEIMAGAENFLRAGNSVEETRNLLKASTIGSAISGQGNEQTSEQLIAIANGFKLNTANAQELMAVIDKLSTVDNNSATSFAELSTAMQYTSSSAKNVGVSMENLISYIGTVSSVSRRSAESIGTSFRTIFSRYEAVSAGKDIDDEGEKINDVEKTLNKIGIAIRKDKEHFKDFNIVIDELRKNWLKLNDLQRSQAVGALAGTRQRENLLILLDNYSQVNSLQEAMGNSANSAQKKFEEAYGKSTQAMIADFKHSIEEFWMGVLDNETINSFIKAGTNIVKILQTISQQSIGTKIAVVASVLAVITVLKHLVITIREISAASKSGTALTALDGLFKLILGKGVTSVGVLESIKTAIMGLKTSLVSLFTTPAGWAVLLGTAAIALATKAIINHIQHQKELKQQTEQLTQSYQALTEAIKNMDNTSLQSETDKLNNSYKQYRDLIIKRDNIQKRLSELQGFSAGYINKDEISYLTVKLSDLNDEIQEQAKVFKNAGYAIDENTGYIKELSEAQVMLKNIKVAESIKKQAEEEFNHKQQIIGLIEEYQQLNDLENQNVAHKERMSQIALELQNSIQGLVVSYDEHGNAIITNMDLLGKEISILKEEGNTVSTVANIKLANAKGEAQIEISKTRVTYTEAKKRIQILMAEARAFSSLQDQYYGTEFGRQISSSVMRVAGELGALQSAVGAIDKIYSMPSAGISGGGTGGFSPKSSGSGGSDKGGKSPSKTGKSIADELVKGYQDRIEELSDNISLLGTIDTPEKRKQLLSYTQQMIDVLKEESTAIQKEIDTITSKIQSATGDTKTQLQETFNILKKELRDVQIDIVKNSEEIQSIFKDLADEYLSLQQQNDETIRDRRIASLQAELDALEERNEAEQDAVSLQEKKLALQKAQEALTNAQREKNVRIYTADKGWVWSADPRAVRDASEAVEQAQKDLLAFEKDLSLKRQREVIEEKIRKEEQAYDRHYQNTEKMTQDFLINLKNQYGDNWDTILSILADKIGSAKALYEELANASLVTIPTPVYAGGSGGSSSYISSSSSGKPTVSVNTPTDAAILKAQYGDSIKVVQKQGSGYTGEDREKTNAYYQSQLSSQGVKPKKDAGDLWKYETGGLNTKPGLAWLDGDISANKPELILESDDTKNILKTVDITRSMFNFIDKIKLHDFSFNRPALAGAGITNHYSFPNMTVKTNDAKGFIKNLQQLAHIDT